MILLGAENLLISEVLRSRFETPSAVDQVLSDFDGVAYHIESSKEGPLTLSMDIRCWAGLVQQGVEETLQNIYGGWIRKGAEPGYNITLEFDYQAVPPAGADRDALIHSVSLLKRNALAAPFQKAFNEQAQLEVQYDPSGPPLTGTLIPIHYRPGESIYILASHDRVTVVFSTRFEEEADRVFGRVFLQEFVDARRQPSIQNAPQVLYSSREPPLEIRSAPGLERGEDTGYVTFVLFPRHFQHPDIQFSTISHIQLFRDYLHYHTYMHSRMRYRVAEFLKVLNRAKPEYAEKQRKTASGRTFRQT